MMLLGEVFSVMGVKVYNEGVKESFFIMIEKFFVLNVESGDDLCIAC